MRQSAAPAAAPPADQSAQGAVAAEPRPGHGASVGPAIVDGHDFEVLVSRSAVTVLVLDAGVGKVDVAVVVVKFRPLW